VIVAARILENEEGDHIEPRELRSDIGRGGPASAPRIIEKA